MKLATHVRHLSLILIASSVSVTSFTNTSSTMYMFDDLQCLAQVSVNDLLKIQKNINMMHAVSVQNTRKNSNPLTLSSKINNNKTSDRSELRDLPDVETRSIFHYFMPSKTTTETPSVASLLMTSDAQGAVNYNRFGYLLHLMFEIFIVFST